MDQQGAEFVIQLFFAVIFQILIFIPVWKIFKKAGKNPLSSLFLLIPGFGFLIISIYLAASKWPSIDGESK